MLFFLRSLSIAFSRLFLALQSGNITGSVDIASVALDKPVFQPPTSFGAFELAAGPIPTVVSGWQRLREAGPLVYPSRIRSAYGVGST